MATAKRTSMRNKLQTLRDDAYDALQCVISGRRQIKRLLRHLRNAPVQHLSFDRNTWSSDAPINCYIFLSQRVSRMEETSNLLAKIDDLPMDTLSYVGLETNGWETEDDKFSGTRKFVRRFIYNGVRLYIQLTAIPEERGANGKPICRKVVVGEKTETRTVPLYEIICDKE